MGITSKLPGMKPGSLIRNVLVGIVYFFGFMFVMGALLGGAGIDSADTGAEAGEGDSVAEASGGEQDSSDTSDSSASDDSYDGASSSDESEPASSDSASSDDDSDSSEASDSSSSEFSVRVIYDGEWSGAVGADGSSQSIDGSGEETFEIEGEPMTISANAQKQDDSSNELTVQILQEGEVVAEQSTTAEYGVAQTSHSNF